MIVRALERGVSEEKLARALNVDVKVIQQRRHLLSGIGSEVAELLKDRPIGHCTFQKLRKMKPIRQLEVAELMVSANNYTFSYVKAPLATSKAADLRRPDELRKATGLSPEHLRVRQRQPIGRRANRSPLARLPFFPLAIPAVVTAPGIAAIAIIVVNRHDLAREAIVVALLLAVCGARLSRGQ
jgi:RepB plasmid partitioning protein